MKTQDAINFLKQDGAGLVNFGYYTSNGRPLNKFYLTMNGKRHTKISTAFAISLFKNKIVCKTDNETAILNLKQHNK